MDENKVIKLDVSKKSSVFEEKKLENNAPSLHTNPILSKMFLSSLTTTKKKFSLKDLFR